MRILAVSAVLALLPIGLPAQGESGAQKATLCDRLASSPTDPDRVTPGVTLTAASARAAINACEADLARKPANLRLKNELLAAYIANGVKGDALVNAYRALGAKYGYDTSLDTNYQLWRALKDDPSRSANMQTFEALINLFGTGYYFELMALIEGRPGIHKIAFLSLLDDYVHDKPFKPANAASCRTSTCGMVTYEKRYYALTMEVLGKLTSDPDLEVASYALKIRDALARDLERPSPFAGVADVYLASADHRRLVSDPAVAPFSAIGKLTYETKEGEGWCTASLIENSRTIVTAAHCITPGATYSFSLAKTPALKSVATVFKVGSSNIDVANWVLWSNFNLDDQKRSADRAPTDAWQDWAILTLTTPLEGGTPLALLSDTDLADLLGNRGSFGDLYSAGYPQDVSGGDKLTYIDCARSGGAEVHENGALNTRVVVNSDTALGVTKQGYKGTFVGRLACRAEHGASGSPILARQADGTFRFAGILVGWYQGSRVTFTTGPAVWDAVKAR